MPSGLTRYRFFSQILFSKPCSATSARSGHPYQIVMEFPQAQKLGTSAGKGSVLKPIFIITFEEWGRFHTVMFVRSVIRVSFHLSTCLTACLVCLSRSHRTSVSRLRLRLRLFCTTSHDVCNTDLLGREVVSFGKRQKRVVFVLFSMDRLNMLG